MRLLPANVLTLLALASIPTATPAQRFGGTWDPYGTQYGPQPGMALGHSVLGVADLDFDGFRDFIVGAPFMDTGSFTDCGEVYAFSGATGALLWTHNGRSSGELRGWCLAPAGDWSSPPDGVMDIAVGSPFYDPLPLVNAGLVKILDGQTGVDIFTFPGVSSGDMFGLSITGGFDFEGDGAPDILVGAPGGDYGGTDSGRCYLHSSTTSTPTFTYDGPSPMALSGFDVAWIGNLDGDLYQDFIVGAPDDSSFGLPSAGQAIALSGATRATLWSYAGLTPNAHLGHAVAGGRDLNGDGVPDFAITAPGTRLGGHPAAGRVELHSGVGGALLHTFDGSADFERLGWSVTLVDDLNHDGRADFFVNGRLAGFEGFLEIRDGFTGLLMQRIEGFAPNDDYGLGADAIGDVNLDGEIELAIGVPGSDPFSMVDAGLVQMLEFVPCLSSSATTLSVSAGGTVDFLLDFPDSEAGRRYALLASRAGTGPTVISDVAIPLSVDPLFLRFKSGGAPPRFHSVYGILDAAGDAAADLVLPSGGPSGLIGTTFWFSAVSATPTKVPRVASVAVSLTMTP